MATVQVKATLLKVWVLVPEHRSTVQHAPIVSHTLCVDAHAGAAMPYSHEFQQTSVAVPVGNLLRPTNFSVKDASFLFITGRIMCQSCRCSTVHKSSLSGFILVLSTHAGSVASCVWARKASEKILAMPLPTRKLNLYQSLRIVNLSDSSIVSDGQQLDVLELQKDESRSARRKQ